MMSSDEITSFLRFSEIMKPILDHGVHGKGIQMTHWDIVRYNDRAYRLEENLISPIMIDAVSIYPVGTFECACCEKEMPLSKSNMAFYDPQFEIRGLHCRNCFLANLPVTMKPATLRMNDIVEIEPQEYVNIIDNRKIGAERDAFWEFCKEGAMNAAEVNGFSYIDGKNMTQIREEMLAKRVIRQFRKNVEKRVKRRVFQVLYPLIGMQAAITNTMQVKIY